MSRNAHAMHKDIDFCARATEPPSADYTGSRGVWLGEGKGQRVHEALKRRGHYCGLPFMFTVALGSSSITGHGQKSRLPNLIPRRK